MYLVRLVYTSSVASQLDDNSIASLLEKAKKNNQTMDLTGMLCFSSDYFLQCLEGSRKAVNATYHRILNDPRHQDIVLLDYAETSKREFAQWGMGYLPDSSLTKDLILSYSGSDEFNPYRMSGQSAHEMMMALRDTIPVI